jgi:hypothetical protein
LTKNKQTPAFLKNYDNLSQVLTDKQLAALGDAYVNLAYSLSLSKRKKRPCGTKVKGTTLAEALRKAGLRTLLPSRIDRHTISDAAEAITVYAWLHGLLTLEDTVRIITEADTPENGLTQLILKAIEKIRLSKLFPVPC